MTRPVRVLIADDHPLFQDGLAALLRNTSVIELVGVAANGAEAVELTGRYRPDVVVMELRMPVLDGVEATRRILADAPETAVLVLTAFDDEDAMLAALRAGVRGYLLKGADGLQVLHAVCAVASGELVFCAGLAERVSHRLTGPRESAKPTFPQLTEREREVLELVAQGHCNSVIAIRLAVSQKTARNHVSNILTKLHVPDRPHAIVRAREAGMGAGQVGIPGPSSRMPGRAGTLAP